MAKKKTTKKRASKKTPNKRRAAGAAPSPLSDPPVDTSSAFDSFFDDTPDAGLEDAHDPAAQVTHGPRPGDQLRMSHHTRMDDRTMEHLQGQFALAEMAAAPEAVGDEMAGPFKPGDHAYEVLVQLRCRVGPFRVGTQRAYLGELALDPRHWNAHLQQRQTAVGPCIQVLSLAPMPVSE